MLVEGGTLEPAIAVAALAKVATGWKAAAVW